jgi:hypothetical protein
MNAALVAVGDTIMGVDGTPMRVVDVEHLYQGDGAFMWLRQILITLVAIDNKAKPDAALERLMFPPLSHHVTEDPC